MKKFLDEFDPKELGTFKCYVDKNFLSPKNVNYGFNLISLYKIENGLFLVPEFESNFFKKQLKPFIIGNKPMTFSNIKVNKIEDIILKSNYTIIKVIALHNTSLTIEINGATDVFQKMHEN